MNFLFIVLFFILDASIMGCATKTQSYGFKDQYFNVFLVEYVKEAEKYNININALNNDIYTLTIRFDDISDPKILGYYSSFNHEIVIDEIEFFEMDYYGQEQLMYHELGHAIFNIKHLDDMISPRCSGSIMHTYFYPCYNVSTRDSYIKRYFTIDIYQTH